MKHNPPATHVVVIGAGLGGISASAYLAQAGYKVTVYEKAGCVGEQARGLGRDGTRVEMRPGDNRMSAELDHWFAAMGVRRLDFGLGSWYPADGFAQVLESMQKVAEKQGVRFVFATEVTGIRSSGRRASRVYVRSNCDEDEVHADVVIAGGDQLYVEDKPLKAGGRLREIRKWGKLTSNPG